MVQSDDLGGQIIAGRYRLTSKLGQGGMGSVWRAEHLALGSEVAIKLIDPAVAENPEVRARFVREAQAAAQLRSPHVVQIIDYGVDGVTPFIAMELMVGESLSDRLDRVGRLSPQETARIVTEVSRALGKAHEIGIIHRDLKPDNIFLVHNDDSEIAKVLDFGVAKKQAYGTEAAGMTSTGAVLGTPYYMSPEQAEGLKDLDHRTDIWALGVITYECLLGVRPFDSETLGGLFLAICTRPKPVPSRLVADLPQGFDEWFERCTARLLPDRFPTARDAASALRDVVNGSYVVAKPGFGFADATLAGGTGPGAARSSRFDSTGGTRTSIPSNTTAPNLSRTVGMGDGDEPLKKGPSSALILGAAAAVLAAGIGAFFALRSPAPPTEPLVAEQPTTGPAEPAAPPAPLPEPAPPVTPPPAPPPAPVASATEPKQEEPAPAPRKARTATRTRTTVAQPAPAPTPKAEPTAKPAPTPSKPAPVNLGI